MNKPLVFATNNPHKLAEIQAMLAGAYQLKDLKSIGCTTDIPENEKTIAGNALAKARYVKQHFGLDCFADDTGLEIDALDGEPGVYSARYAGPEKDANANMDLVLKKLADKANRTARFITFIALIYNNKEYLFEGLVEGKIITEKRGEQGFGYDPIFVPNGFETTFAEMGMEEKAAISHRGRAVAKLVEFLREV
jgi:XTP/dITP diphosphohydrolase